MSDKKRILYHFRVRGTGAEGVHIAGIVNAFRSLGYTVHLLSPTNTDPTKQSPVLSTQDSWYTTAPLLHYLADKVPQPVFEAMEIIYNFFAIPKLFIEISEKEPDFIYERYAFFNFSGALMAHLMKKPLILEVNEISGHKRVRGQYLARLAQLVEKYIFQHADLIITVSDFLSDEIRKRIKNPKNIVTIPNGVPQSWLFNQPDVHEIEKLKGQYNIRGKKVICFVGGLVEWHNFNLLFDVVCSLQADISESVLLIVGDGPLKESLVSQVQKMSLSYNSVLFVGKVAHDKIPLYINLADVAVIPETNSFRSPIKMFEYMAMAKPVVAPRMPAIQVAIEDGKDGILFKPGDCDSMRAGLYRLLSNPSLAKEIGSSAREKISSMFTWEIHASKILSMIEVVINKSDM